MTSLMFNNHPQTLLHTYDVCLVNQDDLNHNHFSYIILTKPWTENGMVRLVGTHDCYLQALVFGRFRFGVWPVVVTVQVSIWRLMYNKSMYRPPKLHKQISINVCNLGGQWKWHGSPCGDVGPHNGRNSCSSTRIDSSSINSGCCSSSRISICHIQ